MPEILVHPPEPPPPAEPSFAKVSLARVGHRGEGNRKQWLWSLMARAVAVAGAGLGAWLLDHVLVITREFGYFLGAVVLALVSVLAAWWVWLLIGNVLCAALLFIPRRAWERLPAGAFCSVAVMHLNRQLGHFEALLPFIVLGMVATSRFVAQVAFVAALLCFGPVLVDWLGFNLPVGRRRARPDTGEKLSWERRIYFYLLTLLGIAVLVLLAPAQALGIKGLILASLAGPLLRTLWFFWERRLPSEESHKLRHQVMQWSSLMDRFTVGFGLVAALAVPLMVFSRGSDSGRQDELNRTRQWRDCAPGPGPRIAELSLFLISDSQFHELDGKRSGVQLGLADAVIPVAARPVELDLLSGISVRRFAELYQSFLADRPRLRWAHLGDFADMGCRGEVNRFLPLVEQLGRDRLAALMVGNHDLTFFGNVAWDPDWDKACRPAVEGSGRGGEPGRATPAWTRGRLREAVAGNGSPPPGVILSEGRGSGFLAYVTLLGRLDDGKGREVLGVFLDSSDFTLFQLGVAGSQGAISSEQADWVARQLEAHRGAYVLLFVHHPVDELQVHDGQDHIERLARKLEGRLLAIVSAHTHLAGVRPHCYGGWSVPELVVGSTIDPPQEASLLDVGKNDQGRVTVRLRTFQSVARPGMTCPAGGPGIDGPDCRQVLERLQTEEACAELLGKRDRPDRWLAQVNRQPGLVDADCVREVERGWPRLQPRLMRVQTPESLACVQQARAWQLLKCLDRDADGARTPLAPLRDPGVASALERQYRDKKDELVCLSWAASLVQGHKDEDWDLAVALEHAMEPLATFGVKEAVVAEGGSCEAP